MMSDYPEYAPYSDGTTSYISAVLIEPDRPGLFAQIRYYLSLVPPDVGHNCEEMEGLIDRTHQCTSARLREMELLGQIKVIEGVCRPTPRDRDGQCYTLSDGIPLDISPRVPRHDIDWTIKPLGPLDWDILRALPKTDANLEKALNRTHQAVSGNRRHLVERGLVHAIAWEWNYDTQRPNKVWGLTARGRQVLASEPTNCGLFGFVINLQRFKNGRR